MGRIKRSTNETSVKFLITTVAMLTVCFTSSVSFGQSTGGVVINNPVNIYVDCTVSEEIANPALCAQRKKDNAAARAADKGGDKCDALKESAIKANADLSKACADGGFTPVTACIDKAMACEVVPREMPSEEGKGGANWQEMVNTVLKGAGLSTAANIGSTASSDSGADPGAKLSDNDCSNMTSEDYDKQRKDLKDDMDRIQKEIKEQQDTLADAQKEGAAAVNKIQDEITDEKQTMAEKKASMDDDGRKAVQDFTQTQNQVKNDIRDKTLKVIQLRGQLTASQGKQVTDMMQMNDAAIEASCAAQAQATYANFQKANAGLSTSFATRKSQKQQVLNQYTTCTGQLKQERINKLAAYRNEQAALTTSITQTQAETGDLQDNVDSAAKQLADMQNQVKEQKAQIDNTLMTKMQTATTKMQTESTNLTQKQSIASAQQEKLNKDLEEVKNKLYALGTRPPAGAKMPPAQVGQAISAAAETIVAYTEYNDGICCPSNGSSVGGSTEAGLCAKAAAFAKLAKGEPVTNGWNDKPKKKKTGSQ